MIRMLDYIFIPSEHIPKDLRGTVEELFTIYIQPKKYIFAFQYRGMVYSGALDRNDILERGSILAELKDKPTTTVQELKEFLTVYQINPNLEELLPELKP